MTAEGRFESWIKIHLHCDCESKPVIVSGSERSRDTHHDVDVLAKDEPMKNDLTSACNEVSVALSDYKRNSLALVHAA